MLIHPRTWGIETTKQHEHNPIHTLIF